VSDRSGQSKLGVCVADAWGLGMVVVTRELLSSSGTTVSPSIQLELRLAYRLKVACASILIRFGSYIRLTADDNVGPDL
jgi:hypothetical protein